MASEVALRSFFYKEERKTPHKKIILIMTADIEDLKLELWLRKRNAGEIIWTTKNKQSISIKDMSDKHLVNTIAFLEKKEELQEIENDFMFNIYKHEDYGDRV